MLQYMLHHTLFNVHPAMGERYTTDVLKIYSLQVCSYYCVIVGENVQIQLPLSAARGGNEL